MATSADDGARHHATCRTTNTMSMAVAMEHADGHERPAGQPGEAADPVPGGAAAADSGSDADEEPGDDGDNRRHADHGQGRGPRQDAGRGRRRSPPRQAGRSRRRAATTPRPARRVEAAENAGNASRPPVEGPEDGDGDAEDRAADGGAQRGEVLHDRFLSFLFRGNIVPAEAATIAAGTGLATRPLIGHAVTGLRGGQRFREDGEGPGLCDSSSDGVRGGAGARRAAGAARGQWRFVFLCLGIALIVDAIDGAAGPEIQSSRSGIPWFDGCGARFRRRLLDLRLRPGLRARDLVAAPSPTT